MSVEERNAEQAVMAALARSLIRISSIAIDEDKARFIVNAPVTIDRAAWDVIEASARGRSVAGTLAHTISKSLKACKQAGEPEQHAHDNNGNVKRISLHQTGWLKLNKFRERGFGIIELDGGSAEVFCHLREFSKDIAEATIYNLDYRRRLRFSISVDPKSDRMRAVNVVPIPEIQAPDGSIIELLPKAKPAERAADTEAEQTEQTAGFGELVAAMR